MIYIIIYLYIIKDLILYIYIYIIIYLCYIEIQYYNQWYIATLELI